MNKKLNLFCLVFTLILSQNTFSQTNVTKDFSINLNAEEVWWGGVTNRGTSMPFGKNNFSFNLLGDDDGNQAAPFLVSNKGRYVWSEKPFAFSFKNGKLLISKTNGQIIVKQNGNSLKTAYLEAAQKYFPSKGLWPDSLLITSPQYNLWIELLYNPNQVDVAKYAQKVLDNNFPPGVLMIDDNWFNFYGQFDFNKEKFPDPKALIDDLHKKGFKVMVWICPFISPDSEPFRELLDKKLLLMDNDNNPKTTWATSTKPLILKWWNGYSGCLDLSNPKAKTWLQSKLDNLQAKYGVDGYKLDAGDAVYYKSKNMLSYQKLLANEHSTFWAEVGLKYPLNEYRAMWKMGGEPLVQRLRDKGHTWEDLQTLVPNTIAQQLVGYTFTCPDMIGGGEWTSFLPGSKLDQKLMVRSAQCSALMPMMQFSAAPWRVLDKAHYEATKKVVDLRQEKMPYIMEVMRKSLASNEPSLRPLEFDFPNQGFVNIKDQFMLGDQLMVAPVITENDTRTVKFPVGKWKYKTEIISGPIIKTFTVAIDELLYFELEK